MAIASWSNSSTASKLVVTFYYLVLFVLSLLILITNL